MLSSLLTHSTTTQRTISDSSCTIQISKYANRRTSRCCQLALLHPLGWSASASFQLPACAPASNFNNDLYFRTRSPSHLVFEPQSPNLPLRRQRPLQYHTKEPSIRECARLPATGPLAFWEECRVRLEVDDGFRCSPGAGSTVQETLVPLF